MAIMLGRLRMSIDDCIEAYTTILDRVLSKKRFRLAIRGRAVERFDSAELEFAIRDVMYKQCERKRSTENMLLREGNGQNTGCKVFVCTTNRQTGDSELLISYLSSRGSSDLFQKTKLWEAIKATTATPTCFDEIKLGDNREELVDGGTGASYPVRHLWVEAKSSLVHPGVSLEENLKCIVSIGTGVPSVRPFAENMQDVATTLLGMAAEAEATAVSSRRDHADLAEDSQYFRFSVIRGLERFGLETASQKHAIVTATRSYLRSPEVMGRLAKFGKHEQENMRSCLR